MLESEFLGGMVGSAVGDAIGQLAFFYRPRHKLLEIVEQVELLEHTDDTAMAIGIAESLTEVGKLDTDHLGETFRKNYEREPWRDYGAGPPTIFGLVRKGASYTEAAESLFGGRGSFGNGAAMRIAPVGVYFHDDPDLYAQAEKSARVTHTHELGVDGAAVLAKAVAMATVLDPQVDFPFDDFCRELQAFARTSEFREKVKLAQELAAGEASNIEVAHQLGADVTAQNSVPFAIYSFLRSPESYEECLFTAVLSGGDRDTMGAMACGISGAYLGIDAIPAQWRKKLEKRELIESLARRLAGMKTA
jgi:poly(ADP-ribose) glycohydrolase ARH3